MPSYFGLGEKSNGFSQTVNKTINFIKCIVDVETAPIGGGDTDTLHNRLGTVVTGTDSNPRSV